MISLRRLFTENHFINGLVIAVVSTLLMYGMFTIMKWLFPAAFESQYLRRQAIYLICIFINLVAFRHYLSVKKFDRTGQGIITAMFLMMVLYFVFLE